MYIGLHKKTKEMKVAFDKHLARKSAYKNGVLPYYEDDDSVAALEDLEVGPIAFPPCALVHLNTLNCGVVRVNACACIWARAHPCVRLCP